MKESNFRYEEIIRLCVFVAIKSHLGKKQPERELLSAVYGKPV